MKTIFQSKTKQEKIKIIIVVSIITIFILLSILSGVLFPNTVFDTVIQNSIGKFFNVYDFFASHYVTILESIAIIIFIWIINVFLVFIVSIFTKKNNKSITVANLLKSVVKYGSVLVTSFLILKAWGVQTPTLLAGAGILGLALSFGAQSLIEDLISGLFIIFENQFTVGDVIQINDFRGTVTEIGIRTTKFVDIYGDTKIINNSDIRGAINTSSNLSLAICNISISYDEDIKKVEQLFKDNLHLVKEKIPQIAEGPFYSGVEELGESSVVLRLYAKTNEMSKYNVARQLRREIKLLFDEHNIKIPFPQVVVHQAPSVKE